MAKAQAPSASPDVETVQVAEPEGPPLPRLSADDGMGHNAPPVQEYDDPSLHSDLAAPPDDEDDIADDEVAEQADQTADDEPAQTVAEQPDTTSNAGTRSGLTPEQEYLIRIGRQAHERMLAEQGRTPPQRQPQSQAQQDDDDAAEEAELAKLDPEVRQLAEASARIASRAIRKQLAPLVTQTSEITSAYRESQHRAREANDRSLAKSTLDNFIKSNAVTRADQDAASIVREEVEEAVNTYFENKRAGVPVGPLDPNEIIALANKKAARLQKAFANRSVRQTQQRSDVVSRTRSTAGGTSPAGAARVPSNQMSEAELRRRAMEKARAAGLR